MNEPKFTPGPWKSYRTVYEYLSGDCSTIFGVECVETRRGICSMCGADSEEMQSNADLMAVAPEMYEELEADADFLLDTAIWLKERMGRILAAEVLYERSQKILALLAKARGEER